MSLKYLKITIIYDHFEGSKNHLVTMIIKFENEMRCKDFVFQIYYHILETYMMSLLNLISGNYKAVFLMKELEVSTSQ